MFAVLLIIALFVIVCLLSVSYVLGWVLCVVYCDCLFVKLCLIV